MKFELWNIISFLFIILVGFISSIGSIFFLNQSQVKFYTQNWPKDRISIAFGKEAILQSFPVTIKLTFVALEHKAEVLGWAP